MAIIKICLGISGIQTPIEMSAFISLMKNGEDKKICNACYGNLMSKRMPQKNP